MAHRDYGLQGLEIEIHLSMTARVLQSRFVGRAYHLGKPARRERVHASRNPRIVRVLTDFGYRRLLGEGIPRMFEVMGREGLHLTELRIEGGRFVLTLRSEPLYQRETIRWLQQFKGLGLSHDQLRLLAYAHEHGNRFTSPAYQKLTSTNPYRATQVIRSLVRKGVVDVAQWL